MYLREEIYKLAEDLSKELQEHPFAKEFEKYQNIIKNDMVAQRLMQELVAMGESLSEKGHRGEPVTAEHNAENMLLQQRLEKNENVKAFINAQKQYLTLIKQVRKAYTTPLIQNHDNSNESE